MRLAGVPPRPDRAQPQLAHQPSDAPASDGNPLAQQRHLQPPAAIHRMLGENPVEPVQQIELIRGRRPGLVIEAAARDPEQPALPVYGQPCIRRDHRPPLSSREMAGCPARKSRSTCNWPILRCRSSMTFCASSTAGALLPRANSSLARFISSCFQVLISVGWTPNSDDSSARVFSPDSAAIAARALNSALCCFLFTPTSHVLWTGQPLAYPAVQKSGAAARLTLHISVISDKALRRRGLRLRFVLRYGNWSFHYSDGAGEDG